MRRIKPLDTDGNDSEKRRPASSRPRLSVDRLDQVLNGILHIIPTDTTTAIRDGPDAVRVMGDTWSAKFWYDAVPERLRVRIVGNMDDADRQITRSVNASNDLLSQMWVRSALREEMDRLSNSVFGAQPLPSQKKGASRKTGEQEERAARDRLTFGDKPVGWARRRKKDQS
jgi:hypothetical protein